MRKAFISKNNPFNEHPSQGEQFSFTYLYPKYWFIWLFLFFTLLIAYFPTRIRAMMGTALGRLLFKFSKSKRDITRKNLSITFKNLDDNGIHNQSKLFFKHLGHMYINLPLLWWRSDKYLQQLITKSDLHLIDEILDKQQSVILLAPHTLSLDFGGRALSKFNLLSIYKPFKNNLMNWFIGKSRSKTTDKVIVYPRNKNSFKSIIKKMKKPCVLYLLADEDISLDDSIFTDFFDTQKATLKSISKLAKLTNSKVLPCMCTYNFESNNFFFKVFPELDNFPSNNIVEDCFKINSCLQQQILFDISQYMWTLRIYKHRPDGSDVYKI